MGEFLNKQLANNIAPSCIYVSMRLERCSCVLVCARFCRLPVDKMVGLQSILKSTSCEESGYPLNKRIICDKTKVI